MSNYWKDRMSAAQNNLSNKSLKDIEKQLKKYYGTAMRSTISRFESVYNKILAQQEDGKAITPADLYRMDAYWKMQGQMRRELERLGDRQISLLSKIFETNYFEIYYSININGAEAFTTIDTSAVKQLINQIWCADGKSWSQRIWQNTSKLLETLNEELVACVIGGKKTSDLKNKLQERFGVSYSQADSLARTEIAHIQTQAAKQRYEDYGIREVQIWADADERRCPECGKLHKKRYPIGAEVPIPRHPRCRCCIVPVIEQITNDKG